MRILITGIAGFVGSSIARMFLRDMEDVSIIGVDNLSYGYIERIQDIQDEIEFIQSDVKDLSMYIDSNVDVIIHCAAIAPLPENQKNLFKCAEQNIAMCAAVSDFATIIGCENIIFFSSGAIYEGSGDRVCSELDDISTKLIYPTSKYLAEKLFSSVALTYNLKIVSVRLFNLYGPRQDYFRQQPPLLGYLFKNIIQGNGITLFASKDAKRDYIYIDDLYTLLCKIIYKFPSIEPGVNIPVNAGSGKTYSVYDILDQISSLLNHPITYTSGEKESFWASYPELFERKLPFQKKFLLDEVDKKSIADISFAENFFDWKPKVDMKQGLVDCYSYARSVITIEE